jgi:ankyrin repeat protein
MGAIQRGMLIVVSAASLAAAADTRLADAAKQGDNEAVRALLTQHADVNAARPDGATALAWASYHDDLAMADLLIGAGAKVNTANDYGVTPLMLACTNRSAPMVDRLVTAGANSNAASEWTGESPLMRCAATGRLEAVKSLLAHGADVKAKDARQGHTALMWALAQRHGDIAAALIEAGADVNAHARSGFTPLMFAAQQGDLESAKALLAAGAKVNESTNAQGLFAGQTALLVASLNGHEKVGMFLLDKGADPNVADENGFTPLHFCLFRGLARLSRVQPRPYTPFLNRSDMPGLLKALLAHGANPNARVKKATAGNEFYKAEASPYRPYEPPPGSISPAGATAFLMATATYDTETMRTLVTAGADPKLATDDNVTPLMVAATMGRPNWTNLNADEAKKAFDAAKLIMELGGDPNASTSSGMTALHAAAYTASDAIIQALADKGANLNARNKSGLAPWDVAVLGQTANGGAGNIHPGLKWNSTVALLRKLGAAPAAASVPDGPGKDTFERVCSGCHELVRITDLRLSDQQWKDKVNSMNRRGAMITDQEIATVVEYLTKYFGPSSDTVAK